MKTRILSYLLFAGLLACGAGADWRTNGTAPRGGAPAGTSSQRVVGKIDCLRWDDSNCRPYERVTDDQSQIGVHLLVSTQGMACEVSGAEATMSMPDDVHACVWRFNRPVF